MTNENKKDLNQEITHPVSFHGRTTDLVDEEYRKVVTYAALGGGVFGVLPTTAQLKLREKKSLKGVNAGLAH
ncbi:MAG: hypothetical protein LBT32_00135 [Peptococcaceae bacterium]|jgi:hypothetical protein|nr:hypothetical protein [Peptococcaceae bacterium]